MPTPATLDIDALLAPIPGDDPSGGPVPFSLRERLDQARKEINLDDFNPRDPMRPAEAKRADWPGIAALTSEALADTSKDLMLVARLIEAQTYLHGFAGLRDGLRLVRRLIDEAWDRLRPKIEDAEDVEVRAAALHWLGDADRGARFPHVVRAARLIDGPAGPISWTDWNLSKSGRATIPAEEIEKAVEATPRGACQAVTDDLDEVVGEFQRLLALMNEKMGHSAPGLGQFRQAVFDCWTLAHQVLERKGPAPEAVGTDAADVGADAEAGPSIAGTIRTREQAYQRLVEIADALEALEPHSPIPFVIRRAVALGQLPFPALMKELISDANVLGDMSRNLGIKELNQ